MHFRMPEKSGRIGAFEHVKMNCMFRRPVFRFAACFALLGLAAGLLTAGAQQPAKRGRKYKAPPPTAKIEVSVLRDTDSKPIENAAVIFHPMEGEKDKGNMELKSNEDGKAVIDVLPIGDTVRLQIIAKGYQTYGADYKVDQGQLAIEIRMKRPGEQYSIYKPHAENKPDQDKPQDQEKPKEDPKPQQ